ncbi:GNAT family N-acetyltransferase [Rhodoferax aquaticus]|uniref:GNAT family N-acetyltransferase n=1 Tax=Rhodoferax aquaticus TaxID=2527691 RepID=A0A515EL56_9BURK|nr:GNAT family N-acetyltransferase [Rhodoferax aquaticus]QDL53395.1 GNAT family N-acetyltransferase [Rhodoferax aquaticus]
MKITVIPAHDLDPSLWAQWADIQQANPHLRSPYYRPEFTQWIACAGGPNPVRVAVLEAQGAVQGFFPFEQSAWGRILPVGFGLNDYHGLIAHPALAIDLAQLLKACGAAYFYFNHLPTSQLAFARHVRVHSASPVMNLEGGWDAYVQRLALAQNTKSPGVLSTVRQSERRLLRDKGPLRFEASEPTPRVLQWIMQTKSAQWLRTQGHGADAFAIPWVRKLMESTVDLGDDAFGATMCTLYAGDSLIAAHVGLRSYATLHYWFPVYDAACAYYQPGLVILKQLAEQAQSQGIELIDLGRGTQDYKMRFKTDLVALGEGAVSRPAWLAAAVASARDAKAVLKAHPQVIKMRAALQAGPAHPHK